MIRKLIGISTINRVVVPDAPNTGLQASNDPEVDKIIRCRTQKKVADQVWSGLGFMVKVLVRNVKG